MVVMSIDSWQESPPANWSTCRKRVSHAQLGGVTEGEFTVYVAYRGPFEGFNLYEELPGVPAKLQNVLQCTGSGRKIPIPDETPEGWTENSRLKWESRFEKIATPTVFYKDSWVKRRLEIKELKGVLDIPVIEECGTALRGRMKAMRMPGKVYGALLGEISGGFKIRKRKRVRMERATEPDSGAAKSSQEASVGASSEGQKTWQETPERSARLTGLCGGPTNTAKATKANNAAVPVYLWNEAICRGMDRLDTDDPKLTEAFCVIRNNLLLPYWKRKVMLDLSQWLVENKDRITPEEYEKSAEAERRAIGYVGKATWSKWDSGSYPFFWRWPEEFQREIRDGLAPRFSGEPLRCTERQQVNPDPELKKKEKENIDKVITFRYLVETCREGLKSLMHFFSVLKGDSDIRMVYNGTKSGLNLAT
jgi:hypothetical protein